MNEPLTDLEKPEGQGSPAAGLYLHVPFCRRRCRYCDFAATTDLSLLPRWLAAVKAEMALYRDLDLRFDTLYLGGGTPTLLSLKDLADLLDHIFAIFRFEADPEVTLEANPDDLSPSLLKGLRELGINRLSLGIQSLADEELSFLGRRHSAAQGLKALKMAREAGFAPLGADLIYGLPGQTLTAWRETLTQVLAFRPEHLSCYQLTLEEGTPLAEAQKAGLFPSLTEEEERRFFLFTAEFLQARGYVHYEIANFAREPRYFCRHNCKYWLRAPYLGLGPAAHSFRHPRRFWNYRDVEAYCAALKAGRAPVAGEEILTREQELLEALFLGLRTIWGVSLELLAELPVNQRGLEELLAAGLVTLKGNRLRATLAGMVVADQLPLTLLH